MSSHSLSVRLPEEQLAQLEALAVIDDVSVGEEVRRAIDTYTRNRAAEPEFEVKMKEALDRHRQMFSTLEKLMPDGA